MFARALLMLSIAGALAACSPRSDKDYQFVARQHAWNQYFAGGAARDAVIACIGLHTPEGAAQLNVSSFTHAPGQDAITEFRSTGEASVYSLSGPTEYVVRVTQPSAPNGGEPTSVAACCPSEASPLCRSAP